MLFVKNGIEIGVDNPVCYNLFVRQGWTPVNDTPAPVVDDETSAAKASVPLTAEPALVIDEPITQIEDAVKDEIREPAIKAETTKTKSTAQKRTYQKRK